LVVFHPSIILVGGGVGAGGVGAGCVGAGRVLCEVVVLLPAVLEQPIKKISKAIRTKNLILFPMLFSFFIIKSHSI